MKLQKQRYFMLMYMTFLVARLDSISVLKQRLKFMKVIIITMRLMEQ